MRSFKNSSIAGSLQSTKLINFKHTVIAVLNNADTYEWVLHFNLHSTCLFAWRQTYVHTSICMYSNRYIRNHLNTLPASFLFSFILSFILVLMPRHTYPRVLVDIYQHQHQHLVHHHLILIFFILFSFLLTLTSHPHILKRSVVVIAVIKVLASIKAKLPTLYVNKYEYSTTALHTFLFHWLSEGLCSIELCCGIIVACRRKKCFHAYPQRVSFWWSFHTINALSRFNFVCSKFSAFA